MTFPSFFFSFKSVRTNSVKVILQLKKKISLYCKHLIFLHSFGEYPGVSVGAGGYCGCEREKERKRKAGDDRYCYSL